MHHRFRPAVRLHLGEDVSETSLYGSITNAELNANGWVRAPLGRQSQYNQFAVCQRFNRLGIYAPEDVGYQLLDNGWVERGLSFLQL